MAIGVQGLTGRGECVRLPGLLAIPFIGAGTENGTPRNLEPRHEAH